jgi:hypothetical protein
VLINDRAIGTDQGKKFVLVVDRPTSSRTAKSNSGRRMKGCA